MNKFVIEVPLFILSPRLTRVGLLLSENSVTDSTGTELLSQTLELQKVKSLFQLLVQLSAAGAKGPPSPLFWA